MDIFSLLQGISPILYWLAFVSVVGYIGLSITFRINKKKEKLEQIPHWNFKFYNWVLFVFKLSIIIRYYIAVIKSL